MNAQVICQLHNLLGALAQAYGANCLAERLEQLSLPGSARLRFPGFDRFAESASEAAAFLAPLEAERRQNRILEIPLLHSPMFSLEAGMAKGNWDVYLFRICKETACLLSAKLEVRFAETVTGWRIAALDWATLYSHLPWSYSSTPNLQFPTLFPRLPDPPEPNLWYAARSLQDFFTLNARKDLEDWLCDDCRLSLEGYGTAAGKGDVLALLRQMEEQQQAQNGDYLFTPVLSAPLIETDHTGARGRWLVLTFEMGRQRPGFVRPIIRRLGVMTSEFALENGRLLLKSMSFRAAAELPPLEYADAMVMPHLMQHPSYKWHHHTHTQHLGYADAIAETENIFAHWVGAMRSGNLHRYPTAYLDDNAAPVKSTLASPIWRSEEKMDAAGYQRWAEDLDSHWTPNEFTYHAIFSPEINPSSDGTTVEARWIDHSITGANQTERPAMVFVAMYSHEFTQVDGRWYQSGFGWEPLLGLPDYRYDPAVTEGALSHGGSYDYRMPLDFHNI